MKKIALNCILLVVVLFSFSTVLAQDTQGLMNMQDLINLLSTQIAATLQPQIEATVVADLQQQLESENLEIIVKNQSTPSPLVNTGYVSGSWKPTVNPLATNAAELVAGPTNNYKAWAHGVQWTSTWTVRNVGKVDWNTEFYFRYKKGQGSLDGDLYMLPYDVKRGDTITFSRSFEAAEEPGIYNSYWQLVDNDGVVILDNIWVGWQVDDWRDFQ